MSKLGKGHGLTLSDDGWGVALEGWAAWCRAAGHSERTIHFRGYALRLFMSYALGLDPRGRIGADSAPMLTYDDPAAVTFADCVAFVGRPGLKPETRRSYGMTLRSFYRWALDMALVDLDPTVRLPKVRIPDTAPRPAPTDVVDQALGSAL
jgi:hypothetical protein